MPIEVASTTEQYKVNPLSESGVKIFDRTVLTLFSIYGEVALVALAFVPSRFLPAEDAIILFQYSRNLAEHGSITFLANGPHVEGATDFGWMLLVAAGIRLHIPPLWFSAGMNVLSLILLAVILLKIAEVQVSLLRLLAIVGSIALMPQILAAASGFAVLPDAVLLSTFVLFVMRGQLERASLAAFVFCLFRPDAVVFTIPLLAYLIVRGPLRWKNAATIGALFAAPGIIYFSWRWIYFGELFPLPFLVKADTHRVLGLFVPHSLHQSLIYLLFAIVMLAPIILRAEARHLWLIVPLVAVPTFFYWAMRLDQNVAARFFFYLPLATAIIIAANWAALGEHKVLVFRVGCLAWSVLLMLPLSREVRTFRDEQFGEVKSIAEELSHATRHGTILTSEAGFIPYFSNWTTYDAWGLNTPEFAHRPLQSSDVGRIRPDLVAFHPDRPESCLVLPSWSSSNYAERSWPHLTRNLTIGAHANHYELWLTSFGSEFYRQRKHWQYGEGDRECWLVRKDSPLYPEITQALRNHHGVTPDKAVALEEEHDRLTPEARPAG
ncbi:hypothetical protein BDD14_4542 [Edaphobacter modestus]|uniref:Glycosyltransferase RgtA/B/C/D-like domain-containing protein n=1 Tax=Edaphobacter modestus TaxID=388466 RepID=A0A4Q7Z056_9BACT|nr:hypothetical protein BDD14_4542 [Edaphobacter modestus]